jgi:hypothetical protein
MFPTEKIEFVFFGKILRGEKYMALIVHNQAQAQLPVLTPEVCHDFAKNLANPRNIKPSHNLSTIGRAVWLIAVQFKNFGNPDRIARELANLHSDGKLYASDLRWVRRDAVVKCDFFSKEDIEEAIHHTILPHNKVAIAALAHIKTALTPRSSPIIRCPGPSPIINPPSPRPNPPSPVVNPPSPIVVDRVPQGIRRKSIIWRRESIEAQQLPTPANRRANISNQALALNRDSLVPAEVLNVLDIEPPEMPIIGHVRTVGLRLDRSTREDALECFKALPLMSQLYVLEVIKDDYVDSFIQEMRESYITLSELATSFKQNGMTPTEVRFRFFAYLEGNKDDAVVSARYKRLIEALTPPA